MKNFILAMLAVEAKQTVTNTFYVHAFLCSQLHYTKTGDVRV